MEVEVEKQEESKVEIEVGDIIDAFHHLHILMELDGRWRWCSLTLAGGYCGGWFNDSYSAKIKGKEMLKNGTLYSQNEYKLVLVKK